MPDRLFCIAGWAYDGKVLNGLAAYLPASFETHCLSPAHLLKEDINHASDSPPASAYARSLSRQINRQGGPCSIIAWSMGAVIALEAVSLFALPVHKLVIINGTAKFCSAPDYHNGIPEKNIRAMKAGLLKNPEKTLSLFFHDAASPATPDAAVVDERIKTALSFGTKTLRDGLTCLQETDLRQHLKDIAVPVLVIHGEQDRIIPQAAARFLHARLPQSTLHSFRNAGHSFCIDTPERVGQMIFEFIAKGTASDET